MPEKVAQMKELFAMEAATNKVYPVGGGLWVPFMRLLDEVDDLGYGDNTLVFYIWGDNGSSGEGQLGTVPLST